MDYLQLEDDGVTGSSSNAGGIENKLAGSTNNNLVDSTLRRNRGGSRRVRV